MSFRALYDLYMEDIRPRIRPTTYRSKEYMFAKKYCRSLQTYPAIRSLLQKYGSGKMS